MAKALKDMTKDELIDNLNKVSDENTKKDQLIKKMQDEKAKQAKQSIYERLSKINVKPYLNTIEGYAKKSHKYFKLSYLSWAKAWGLVKAIYPTARYDIKEYPNWVQCSDGTFQQVGTLDYRITSVGCEVEVTVTIENQKFTQKLYPMDRSNSPILKPNIKDINKAQLRCLVKALATAGLGLDVYAGEDLPSTEDETAHKQKASVQPRRQYNGGNYRQSSKPSPAAQAAANKIANDTAKKVAYVKAMKIPFGGGDPVLLTDLLGLVQDKDRDAPGVLQAWLGKDNASHSRHNMVAFVRNNNLVTHNVKAVPEK